MSRSWMGRMPSPRCDWSARSGRRRRRGGWSIMRPRVGFDVSGGPRVGFGHLGRCLGLAEAFSDLGWEVVFRRPPDPLAAAYIARRGFSLAEGPDGWTVGVFDHPTPLHPEILSGVPVGVLVDDFGASRLLADLVVYPPTDRVQQLDWTDARGRCLAGFP